MNEQISNMDPDQRLCISSDDKKGTLLTSSTKTPSRGEVTPKLSINDFIILKEIGKGAFSHVHIVQKK